MLIVPNAVKFGLLTINLNANIFIDFVQDSYAIGILRNIRGIPAKFIWGGAHLTVTLDCHPIGDIVPGINSSGKICKRWQLWRSEKIVRNDRCNVYFQFGYWVKQQRGSE
jgi:hypothetical protein